VLADPLKGLFFQTVRDGTLDADLNRRLYKQFEKAVSGRSRTFKILVSSLAAGGILGLARSLYKRIRKR
jgi:hypothetical protein